MATHDEPTLFSQLWAQATRSAWHPLHLIFSGQNAGKLIAEVSTPLEQLVDRPH
jgi:hypothetical protein